MQPIHRERKGMSNALNSMQQFKAEMSDLNLDAAYLAERPEVIHDLDLETERLMQQAIIEPLRFQLFTDRLERITRNDFTGYSGAFGAKNMHVTGTLLKTADGTRTILRREK